MKRLTSIAESKKPAKRSSKCESPTILLNIDFFAGRLIYHGIDADTPNKVLAFMGDGMTDSNHFLSTIGMKKESYIEFS